MRTDLENLLDYMVSNGYHEGDTGHVDSPIGHVAIVDMSRDLDVLQDNYLRDDPYATWPADLTPGWHIVTTTDQGFIRDDRYGSEDDARDAFDKAEESYALWDDEGDDDDAPVDATHGPCSHPLCCDD